MARKNALTMEEIQTGLKNAHSKAERCDFLMNLTVKQLKEFAKHQDYSGLMSYMKKADIVEYILGKTFEEMELEYSRNMSLEMDETMQETPEQPELNETSEVQTKDYEAENRTVEKVLALYVPPKQSVKNIHRLSKALIAEQRLEKWKIKHTVFWARGMPDKTKRKFLKRLEEF